MARHICCGTIDGAFVEIILSYDFLFDAICALLFCKRVGALAKRRGVPGTRLSSKDISDKPLSLYFPKEAAHIKRRILEQTDNPFSKGYIVDVHVQFAGDRPVLYSVIELHEIIDLEDKE